MLLDVPAVDPETPQSPALQAYRILERAVGDGFPPGIRLPAERELAGRLKISRSTLRQVLGALADSGLITNHPQRGWFVADGSSAPPSASDPPDALVSFTESAHQRGLRSGGCVLSHVVRLITLSEQEVFQAAPGTQVLEVERLRTLDGTPVCVNLSVVVLTRVPGIETVDLRDTSLYVEMMRVAGVKPVRADYAVHADAADETTARHLWIEVGAPVLVGHDVSYSKVGAALVSSRSVYRADAYVFRATIRSS